MTRIRQAGSNLTLEGIALNNETVSKFMIDMEKSDLFSGVAGRTRQQIINDRRLMYFSITCQVNLEKAQEPEPEDKPSRKREWLIGDKVKKGGAISWDKVGKMKMAIKLAIFFGTLAVLALVFIFVVYMGQKSSLEKAEKQIDTLNAKITELNKNLARRDEIRAELKRNEDEFEFLQSFLPKGMELPKLLGQISSQVADSDLYALSFSPQEETKRDFYAENTIDMKLDGPYLSVAQFFEKVARMERIVSISDYEIVGPLAGDVGKAPTIVSDRTKFEKTGKMDEPRLEEEKLMLTTTCKAITYRLLTDEELEAIKRAEEEAKKKK